MKSRHLAIAAAVLAIGAGILPEAAGAQAPPATTSRTTSTTIRHTSTTGLAATTTTRRTTRTRRARATRINVNTASRKQLLGLGLSTTTVDRLIAGRPYAAVADLETNGVLTTAEYRQLRHRLVKTSGTTTTTTTHVRTGGKTTPSTMPGMGGTMPGSHPAPFDTTRHDNVFRNPTGLDTLRPGMPPDTMGGRPPGPR